ncbi:MAG: AraC family transcriptional regulator [Paenibacillus sp.]|nr:AraC family transcriptional regulator [Paenibacillus sp.]
MMFEFLFVLDGKLTAFHGNVEQELKAGDLVLISPMQLHGYEVQQAEGASFFDGHIQIEDEALLHLFETENLAFYSKSHPLNEALRPWIMDLMEALQENPLRSTKVMLNVLNIIEESHSFFKNTAAKKGPKEHREPAYIIAKEIERLMRKSPILEETNTSFSGAEEGLVLGSNWLEEISRQLNISSRHCHRLFRQAYGMSPRQYLMILKQQEAMQLLASSNETIEHIAYRLGYVNAQSFSRQFAAWVGYTPGAFRKNTPEAITYLRSLPQSK